MRLVTYQYQEPGTRVGFIDGDQVVDLTEAIAGAGVGAATMLDLIRLGTANDLARLSQLGSRRVPLAGARLHAPIPRPAHNIICLGRNYHGHAAEMAKARREDATPPTFFTKAVTTVIGPHDDIPYNPELSTQLDWEVELACVIGARARQVSRDQALAHVFGYMVLNDVSARDLQYGYGGQFFYGKSLDGSCPTGPCLVTTDEIPDPHRLSISLCINGKTEQSSETGNMIFDIPQIIEILTRAMTLEPGQIIATGTPPGVGYARQPQRFLQPDDLMESEIEGIGTLSNRVRQI